jgi:hypothetical protein
VAADVALNSPPPGATIADIVALFANKFNLTAKDVAVLSGTLTLLLLLLLLLFSANTFLEKLKTRKKKKGDRESDIGSPWAVFIIGFTQWAE